MLRFRTRPEPGRVSNPTVVALEKGTWKETKAHPLQKRMDAIGARSTWIEMHGDGKEDDVTAEVVLGVERDATQEEVRRAYRIRASECHPDRGGSPWAFQTVQKAYQELLERFAGDDGEMEKKSCKQRGLLAFRAKRYEEACQWFERALLAKEGGESQTAALYSNLAAANCARQDYKAALRASEKCIRERPDWIKGYYRRAEALVGLQEFEKAERALLSALELNPEEPGIREKLAQVKQQSDRSEGAQSTKIPQKGDTLPSWSKSQNVHELTQELQNLTNAIGAIEIATERELNVLSESFPGKSVEEIKASLQAKANEKRALLASHDSPDPAGQPSGIASPPHAVPTETIDSALRPERSSNLPPFKKIRCKVCGNIVHRHMKVCTSCCLPLTDSKFFEPCFDVPVAGGEVPNFQQSKPREISARSGQDALGPDLSKLQREECQPPQPRGKGRDESKGSALSKLRKRKTHGVTKQTTLFGGGGNEDKTLTAAYTWLGLPSAAGQATIRKRYFELLMEEHPDKGGEAEDHSSLCEAYNCITQARIVESQNIHKQDADAECSAQDSSSASARIFVAMVCYRDSEGIRTIEHLLRMASHKDRVTVGVLWQYANTEFQVVTRYFTEVNTLTAEIENRAGNIPDESERQKYLETCLPQQLKLQQSEQAKEIASHTRKSLPDELQAHVREMHMSFLDADGSAYSHHLLEQLWGGEEFIFLIDSRVRFVKGWDVLLMEEHSCCPSSKSILTATCLYSKPQEDLGTAAEEPADNRPPVITAVGFSRGGVPIFSGQRLKEVPQQPKPTFFWNPSFSFSKAEALMKDVRYDVHMAHLDHGEDISMAVRLFTHGWDCFCPRRNVCFSSDSTPYRKTLWDEDHRSGYRLYAAPYESSGTEQEQGLKSFQRLSSRRRVLQLLGAPDSDASQIDLGIHGLGESRSLERFLSGSGVDCKAGQLHPHARCGGLPAHELAFGPPSKCDR